ncbi:cytochrome b/b6 domain-containing protein [Microbacterium sp. Leaf151]|uniref:cytochrome b/b6 domain-containing protein n=1 Tax=Microbacterium sp. Leaf151 TaxID=1736276 RepID=UPI0009E960D7|nr:cytochrome b/b6 domain-containing protein [Microbacterium sp. Leaf151]
MASTPRTPRRGLPRVPGGEPWPPAAFGVPEVVEANAVDSSSVAAGTSRSAGSEASGDEAAPNAARASQNGADLADIARDAASIGSFSEDARADATDSTYARADATDSTYARADATDSTPLPGAAPHPVAGSHPGPASDPVAARGTDATPAVASVRRGLPREPGGEPWPPTPSAVAGSVSGAQARAAAPAAVTDSDAGTWIERSADSVAVPAVRGDSDPSAHGSAAEEIPAHSNVDHPRRGLPREAGGEPWPPAPEPEALSLHPAAAADVPTSGSAASGSSRSDDAPTSGGAASGPEPTSADSLAVASTPLAEASPTAPIEAAPSEPASEHVSTAPRAPLTVRRTVWPGAAASAARPARTDPKRIGPYTSLQWLGSTAVLGVFALALAGITVLVARFLLALGPGQEFLAAYPGEYPLPDSAPVGIPAWLNWSHFLNSFFLLFIIRTGWQVRSEKRPAAFWSPRKNKRRRISLTLWFHQAIDILWIANGVVFVVLLFVTGQWMRIVPTSWEVFPNALSAALQYVSLDWPTENGWVNYNSLQQLSYFAITFLAAPLAIVSGVRLSGVWPKDAERLNRMYPVEWARKVHFPVMLFFVAFIVVHVALVLATGALRNLNHMYAARGSVDPAAFTSDPTGLLIFAASLLVMAVGWAAARPRVLVPIARLFGDVKQR